MSLQNLAVCCCCCCFLHLTLVALAACAGAQSWTRHSKSVLTCYAEGAWLSCSPETPKQYHFWDWAAETDIYNIRPKKKMSYSSAVRFLYCLADFKPVARCVAVSGSFFCLQPSLSMNLQTVFFPRTGPLLANYCESCLVKFSFVSFLPNFFLGASFRIFCLPVLFLSSKSSFLDDHFTTQRWDFSGFF